MKLTIGDKVHYIEARLDSHGEITLTVLFNGHLESRFLTPQDAHRLAAWLEAAAIVAESE